MSFGAPDPALRKRLPLVQRLLRATEGLQVLGEGRLEVPQDRGTLHLRGERSQPEQVSYRVDEVQQYPVFLFSFLGQPVMGKPSAVLSKSAENRSGCTLGSYSGGDVKSILFSCRLLLDLNTNQQETLRVQHIHVHLRRVIDRAGNHLPAYR